MPPGAANNPSPGAQATQANTAALLELTAQVMRAAGALETKTGHAVLGGHAAELGGEKQDDKRGRRGGLLDGLLGGRGGGLLGNLFGGAGGGLQRAGARVLGSAQAGAQAGAKLGPVGAAAGGVAGLGLGVVKEGFKQLLSPVLGLVSMFGKVIGLLTPVAILAAAVSSAASGFSTLLTAVKVLGNTLGTLLMPVFAVLAAGIVTLSDYIWSQLLPVLGEYYSAIVGGAFEAVDILTAAFDTAKTLIVAFATSIWETGKEIKAGAVAAAMVLQKAVQSAVQGMINLIRKLPGGERIVKGIGMAGDAVKSMTGGKGGVGAGLLGAAVGPLGMIGGAIGRDLSKSVGGLFEQNLAKRKRENSGEGGLKDKFEKNLKAVLEEMRRKTAPQAQAMGVAQASRSAQIAALNMSPFERKMLDTQVAAVGLLGRVVNNTNRQVDPANDYN